MQQQSTGPWRSPSGGRVSFLDPSTIDVLELELQRAEGKPRFHADHQPQRSIGEPDLGVAVLGENPLALDPRPDDDGVKLASRDLDPFPSQDRELHRIAVRLEIPIELVRLTDLEWQCANEVDEGAVVKGQSDARLLRLAILAEGLALRVHLVIAFALVAPLVD